MIKNIFIIFTVLCFLSCNKVPTEIINNNKIEASSKIQKSEYHEVYYESKKLINGINVFEFKDNTITLQYVTSTLFGMTNNKVFNIFNSNYDLDLGEINLLRFDNQNSQVYIVELKDDNDVSYNLYFVENNKIYYLGTKDIDLSKLYKNDVPNPIVITKMENKIFLNSFNQISSFRIESPLKPIKTFDKIEDYIEIKKVKDNSESKNSKIEKENEYFSINVDEDEVMTVQLKKEHKKYINNNVLEGYSNCPDTSLDEIVLKNNYFTIQKYNCNDKYFLKEYVTFKQDGNSLILHKYSVEVIDKYDPDKVIPNKTYTSKNFGIVNFESIDKNFLNKLSIK